MKKLFSIFLFTTFVLIGFIVLPSFSKAEALGCNSSLYRFNYSDGTDYLAKYSSCVTQTDLNNRPSYYPNPQDYLNGKQKCSVDVVNGGKCSTIDDAPGVNNCSYGIYMYVCDGKQNSCLNYSCTPGSAGCNRSTVDGGSTYNVTPVLNPDSNGNSRGMCSSGADRHYLETVISDQAARVGPGKTVELVLMNVEWYGECVAPGHPYPNHWDENVCRGVKLDGSPNLYGSIADSIVWYTGDPYGATCDSISPPQDSSLAVRQVRAGYSYTGSVTMRNTGGYTWTNAENYRLGAQNPQDNLYWGTNRAYLTSASLQTVSNGQATTFTFPVTAPSTLGTYNFDWKMLREGVTWFGATCSTSLTVCASNTGAACNRNACGGTGVVQCNGTCSASAPSIPWNYGVVCGKNSCGDGGGTVDCSGFCSVAQQPERTGWFTSCSTASSPNSCGDKNYNNGYKTVCNADGSLGCSASAPAAPPERTGWNTSCSAASASNSCGDRNYNYGSKTVCNGDGSLSCSVSAPAAPAERPGWYTSCSAASASNSCGDRNYNYGYNIVCNGDGSLSCSVGAPASPGERAGYGTSCGSNSCGDNPGYTKVICNADGSVSCNGQQPERSGWNSFCTVTTTNTYCSTNVSNTSSGNKTVCNGDGTLGCNAVTPVSPPCPKDLWISKGTDASGTYYGKSGLRTTQGGGNVYNSLKIEPEADPGTSDANINLIGSLLSTTAPTSLTLAAFQTSAQNSNGFILLYANKTVTVNSQAFTALNHYIYYRGSWNAFTTSYDYPANCINVNNGASCEIYVRVLSGSLLPKKPAFGVTLYKNLGSKNFKTYLYLNDSSNLRETAPQKRVCDSSGNCTSSSLPLASFFPDYLVAGVTSYFQNIFKTFAKN